MNWVHNSWDLNNRYTIWTGILGGTFLMLSYFGTDQSQVQRYLSGKSLRESQLGLIFNGLLKIPMQFFILLVGVMVFIFFQFTSAPLNFNPKAEEAVINSEFALAYKKLQIKHKQIEEKKKIIITKELTDKAKKQLLVLNEKDIQLKEQAKIIIEKANSEVETNDKDYIFIRFILKYLPEGLVGLLLAVILSAAMSSTASELNALASTTTIDLYQRNFSGKYADEHYVKASKWFTLGWGILAIIVACVANLFDNLIQLVNIIGSIFYGNVLGIFLVAFFVKFVKGHSVFISAIITQLIIIVVWFIDVLPYLWLNALGCIIVMMLSILFQQISSIFKLKRV